MLPPVGAAAKRLAGFALLALLAFAATQWPQETSRAGPVAKAAVSAALEFKCVPLLTQPAGLPATAAGCSAAAGGGARPQSCYPVELHLSPSKAVVGSDCQRDGERVGHAQLGVASMDIQTYKNEGRCFREQPSNTRQKYDKSSMPDESTPSGVDSGRVSTAPAAFTKCRQAGFACVQELLAPHARAALGVLFAPLRCRPGHAGHLVGLLSGPLRILSSSECREVGPGQPVIDFAGDHRVAHPGVCNDAGSPSHTSTDVVAEVLGSTGTCATARHFSNFFSKSISLLLVFFSVLLRSLGALSFKAQATTSSRGHRLTQPTSISGLGGWDPGNAGRIASAATDSSRGAGGGCVGSLGAAR